MNAGSQPPPPSSVWRTYPLPTDGIIAFRFGPLRLTVQAVLGELRRYIERDPSEQIICRVEPEADAVPAVVPDRFAGFDLPRTLQPVPAMPDRSLVVRPDNPVHILPGETAEFFVGVPLYIAIQVEGRHSHRLPPVPTTPLAPAWSGDPTSGELCHVIPTKARRRLSDVVVRGWRAVCPLQIVNRRPEILPASRFIIQSAHLSIHEGRTHLWTTPVRIEAEPGSQDITVHYDEKPPAHEPVLRQLAPAREPVRRSLLTRGLDILNLTTRS